MAKIVIAGDAVVLTSELKLEDIKTIEKYRPEALVLKGGEDGKEPLFRLGTTDGPCKISQYGAEFSNETRDETKRAMMTLFIKGDSENIKEVVADKFGSCVAMLNKLESTLPAVLNEIQNEKTQIMNSIALV